MAGARQGLAKWLLLDREIVEAGHRLSRVFDGPCCASGCLPGYRDYAARVRYRLVPGIW
jgi:hypothetical protein